MLLPRRYEGSFLQTSKPDVGRNHSSMATVSRLQQSSGHKSRTSVSGGRGLVNVLSWHCFRCDSVIS